MWNKRVLAVFIYLLAVPGFELSVNVEQKNKAKFE
jgi:hypothetical protein